MKLNAYNSEGFQHCACVIRVLLADEHFESTASPGDVRPHAADRIGLDDGVDARCFQCTFGQIRLRLTSERMNRN